MIKPKVKKFNLNEEELSDYMFAFRLMKERQMEAEFWQNKVNWTRTNALKRVGVDLEKYTSNWESTLDDGTFTATEKGVDSGKK